METLKFKAVAWKVFTLPPIMIVYIMLVAPGLRFIAPEFGVKLHKFPLPGFSYLRHYEGFDRMDLAHIFAVIMLVAVWYFLLKLMTIVFDDKFYFANKSWNSEPYSWFVLAAGLVLLVIDCVLFYTSLTCHGSVWGGSVFSFSATLATLLYLSLNLFIVFVTFNLQHS